MSICEVLTTGGIGRAAEWEPLALDLLAAHPEVLRPQRADEIGAAGAYRIGFVQEVVEPGSRVQRALQLAREIASRAPLASVNSLADARLAIVDAPVAAVAVIPTTAYELMASQDFREGITSFLERRPARFTGR
ncbi:enoyl-CoA hydratase-related protein [Streptomyces sp. NPDC050743]|uniref:enoyl-CoA hydratase-related protein n=1 Tax=Streptomyces sp. NPDC050743 TaxID=3365634 RepID=UPI0037A68A54